jgi:general secretion pathway protein J
MRSQHSDQSYVFPMIARRSQSGFTLLEMLIALTVLGLLIVGLNQGVRTGLRVWTKQDQQSAEVAELGTTARLLRMLLSGIPLAPSANASPGSSPLAIAIDGTGNGLAFVADLPSGLGMLRRSDIVLSVTGDRLVLRWKTRRPELANTAQAWNDTDLLHGVAGVQFAYYGPPAPGLPTAWLTQWDGPAIPELIRVRLTFTQGDPRHWPDLIVAPRLAPRES